MGEAVLIDGKAEAARLRGRVAEAVAALAPRAVVPGLATVLVGADPASRIYVRNKVRACAEAGLRSIGHTLAATAAQDELLALIERLNGDPEVDGILVQLPLPAGMDADRGDRGDRPGQGRRRLPPGQCRPALRRARCPGALQPRRAA